MSKIFDEKNNNNEINEKEKQIKERNYLEMDDESKIIIFLFVL